MANVNLLGEEIEPVASARTPGKPKYQYRFTEGAAEVAVDQDGHHHVLRCGDIEPGNRVWLTAAGPKERGVVKTLIPGFGPPPRSITAVVQWDRPMTTKRDQDGRTMTIERFGRYPVEQLKRSK